ncbi:head GIN domain-containing protein [Flammeovirga kamogawensis]|uniref:DUF2807 domain-containing protein n=1 Tax=Flammeovirga kamogawensis TaxID=373891 RepID=A0ABX8GUI8_9BACT|nr:head GIN domain-containing protein [Flammeovirga kamogawensis]MBB6459678.1 hypothetical protein [Flammeovirga kamogawensis]QWG07260.1 DUF2807 domain-containing protein [Flammeovirga kamogawensis]TRX69080.1 DUF2807 domain-containing protein [Flammeovirga kamogawensis]
MKSIILTSLFSLFSILSFAQKKDTKPFPCKDFTKLELDGGFNVVLVKGEYCSAYAEGKTKDLEEMKMVQSGDRLSFTNIKKKNNGSDKNINGKNDLTLYIQIVDLKEIESNLVGTLTNEGVLNFNNLKLEMNSVGGTTLRFNLNHLDFEYNGIGKVELVGNAKSTNLEYSGIGSVDARDFLVKDMIIECDGIGSVKVNASNSIKMESSGIGSIKNYGNAKD